MAAETISVDRLQRLGACEPSRKWLERTFGEGEVPLADALRAVADLYVGPGWVSWYLQHLPPVAWAAYRAVAEPAAVAYHAVVDPAWTAYYAKASDDNTARETYLATEKVADATYDAACRAAIRAAADALDVNADGR